MDTSRAATQPAVLTAPVAPAVARLVLHEHHHLGQDDTGGEGAKIPTRLPPGLRYAAAGYRVAVSAGAARCHSRRVMRPVKMRMTVLVVAVS